MVVLCVFARNNVWYVRDYIECDFDLVDDDQFILFFIMAKWRVVSVLKLVETINHC